ncbi:MAG: CopD family protein [Rhodobacteraceae bacterium]|nr:CopD family protein [Paracoccaceae bacterium]MCY4139333.1 CopD family protein [Paracoccaceae bacterium]
MPDTWELASILVRSLLYLGALASVGQVLVRIVFHRETSGLRDAFVWRVMAFATLAFLSALVGFALKGAAMVGELSGMTDPVMLGILWQTPVGTALVLRVAGLVTILVAIWIPAVGLKIAAAGGVVVLWSFTLVGHVAEAGPFWLNFLLLLHLICASFWIGILSPLGILAGKSEEFDLAAGLGHRFGRIAAFTVPVLIVAGAVIAWHLLGDFASLVGTGYGLALLAKIGVMALLLAAAAANKFRFVPAMKRGDRGGAIALRRSITFEWAAVCLVLLATAALTTLPDPPMGSDP